MTWVKSSAFRRIGYDTPTKRLVVEFNDGIVYEYRPVPVSVYRALMSAESKGRFIDQHIKLHYIYQEVHAGD